ncbi:MAG TPA: hypothetical protein VH643_34710 [Gemmataceae bacterium]|jgi:hypothetical protein
MCPLRLVEDHRAGPSALGILVPPGRRTFLIVRPRSLAWDLLLLRPDSPTAFRELYPEQAGRIAEALSEELNNWSHGGRIEEIACPDGLGYWLHVRVGPFVLALCGRCPGQPYQPRAFRDAEEARTAAVELRSILCPPTGIYQEVYLNNRHFSR